ncbi:MAG: PilZ domain-containing protein [Verrucomicrobia bacterium]|nr:PilZ domain-containing protein [Verrucomicrobiota bacterium]
MMAVRVSQHDERRRFIRHPACVPVRCEKQGVIAGDHHELRDISDGGPSFLAPESYEPGDLLLVEFPTLKSRIGLSGEVMWAYPEKAGTPARYATGLRFLHPQTFLKARIIEQLCHIEAYREAQQRECGRALTSSEAAREWIALCASRFPGAD